MTIEEFRDHYLRLCKDHCIDPQECIITALGSAHKTKRPDGYCLNLSTHSLTIKTCTVLAKLLAYDRAFVDIRFSDCMICEEGMRALATGLAQNVACKKLDLKGNNIRASAGDALGRMLKQNGALLSLCLEWNALGMLDASFGTFCEGLAANTTLQILDLRNNQITHDGSASLASALKRNSTLRMLDLRWNNVGLIGGRHILSALDCNKTICRLELAGNNTPNDVIKAIAVAVHHNADRSVLAEDYETRQRMLSKEIQETKRSRSIEMSGYLDKLEEKDAEIRRATRSASNKVCQLQDTLEERKAYLNTVVSKLALAESELSISESKINELCSLLTQSKEDLASMAKDHQLEFKREREDRAVKEGKLTRQLIEVEESCRNLETKLVELEHKCKGLQDENYILKEKLTNSQAEHKMKVGQYEDKIHLEKQKSAEFLKDSENKLQKEIEYVKHNSEEDLHRWREKANRIESTKIELEEEIGRLKAIIGEERLHTEEELHRLRTHLREEMEERNKQSDDRLRAACQQKDEIQHHTVHLSHTITDLQSKNSTLVLENETFKRKVDELTLELQGKNSEMMTEVTKAKLELQQKINKMENERQTQEQLYSQINTFKTELAELKTSHKITISEKESEIHNLKDRLKAFDAEMSRLRQDEVQRAALLQAAVNSYLSRPTLTAV